jgi:hypothetical protein
MAVSSSLAKVFTGLGTGYLNALNQGRRERSTMFTNMQRVKSDKQRNALESLKLGLMQEEANRKAASDADQASYQRQLARNSMIQNAHSAVAPFLKMANETNDPDQQTTLLSNARNIFKRVAGVGPGRDFGLEDNEIFDMLPLPGDKLAGVQELGIVPGEQIKQPTGGMVGQILPYSEAVKMEPEPEKLTPTQSILGRNQQTGNFITGQRMNLTPQQSQQYGIYGPPNIQGADSEDRAMQKAVWNMDAPAPWKRPQGQPFVPPTDVVAYGNRAPKEGMVQARAKYGLGTLAEGKYDKLVADTGLARTRQKDLDAKLAPSIALINQRIASLQNNDKYKAYIAQFAGLKAQIAQDRLAIAQYLEEGRMFRHAQNLGQRGAEFDFKKSENLQKVIQTANDTLNNYRTTIQVGTKAYFDLMGNQTLTPKMKAEARAIFDSVRETEKMSKEYENWVRAETGDSAEAAAIKGNAITTHNLAAAWLRKNPNDTEVKKIYDESAARAYNPSAFQMPGTTHGYRYGAGIGYQTDVSPETEDTWKAGSFGGREADSGGAFPEVAPGAGKRPSITPPKPGGANPPKPPAPAPPKPPKPGPPQPPKPATPKPTPPKPFDPNAWLKERRAGRTQ